MDEREGNRAAVRAFFDQWQLYDLCVRNDYMFHREIHRALRTSLSASRLTPFSVMDLGCGDSAVIAETLRGLPVTKYVGVDLSEIALGLARERFADAPFSLELVAANLGEYVSRGDASPVDVAVAGFAVHHLHDDEKARFFIDCAAKLHPGGELYLYDVFRQEKQKRDEYLDAYCGQLEHWHDLTADQIGSIIEHIRAFDFPCSYEVMADFARAAGFQVSIDPLYSDDRGFHRLYRFESGRPA